MDGLRACLIDEFQSIHLFNLRGNQRTSGEVSRQEGGKIFGSGSRNSVAITLLVKNPSKTGACTHRYHDIGDYLTREEKLAIIKGFSSVSGIEKANKWTMLAPNDDHDWINQRDPAFEKFVPIGDKEDDSATIFSLFSRGLATSRDSWCYNFSERMRRGKAVEPLGGGVRFCTLGKAQAGEKDAKVQALLGVFERRAVYLLFNGVLGDRKPNGGNVLTSAVLEALPDHDGPKVVYGEACRLGEARLRAAGVTFKQVPWEVRVG